MSNLTTTINEGDKMENMSCAHMMMLIYGNVYGDKEGNII